MTPHKAGESREQLVDNLEEVGDYWLSVTDAARVTRRQDITIRRWITARALPVRRQRMGLNKRTRHIRAFDLAKLTPIIDPAATITGAPANADLMSIPLQQAQIMTTQHELVARWHHLQQALDISAAQHADDQRRLEEHQQEAVDTVRQEVRIQINRVQEGETAHHEKMTREMRLQEEAVTQTLHRFKQMLHQEVGTRHTRDAEVTALLQTQALAIHTLEGRVQQLQTQAEQDRQQWMTSTEEHHHALQHLHTQMQVESQEQLVTIEHTWQRRFLDLHTQYALLTVQLQTERQRRLLVEAKVQQLQRRGMRSRRTPSRAQPST